MRKVLTAVLAASGLIGFSAAQAAPIQWTSGVGANGHYYEFVSGAFTWAEALADAASHNYLGMTGYLATAVNAEENQFVSIDVADGQLSWLAGSDDGNEAHWTWRAGPEIGQALTYFNWNPGEPNNCCGGENFLQTNWAIPAGWNDHGAPGNAGQRNGYVVEFSAANGVPEPASIALALGGLLAAAGVRRRTR